MKDVKKAFELIVESLKLPTYKTIKELIKRLEALEKTVAKSIAATKTQKRRKATAKKKKPIKVKVTPAKKAAQKKKTVTKKVKKAVTKKKTVAKKAKKAAPKTTSGQKSATEQVLNTIRKSSKGATVAMLRKTTRLESKQVSNIVFRLLKQKKLVKKGRGVYSIK